MIRLKRCTRNPDHWYSDHGVSCPWCWMLQENKTDSFPGVGVDYPVARQTVGTEIPLFPEINASAHEPQIPIATTTHSRKWTYIGAILAVVVILSLGVLLANSSSATMAFNPTGTTNSGMSPLNQKMTELSRLFQQKDYSGAITKADEILALDPNNKNALYMKGMALRLIGDTEESLEIMDRVLQIDPRYVGAWSQKGWAFQDLGRYQEEVDSFDKAIQFETNVTNTKNSWYGKGQALRNLGRYDEAISAFNRALELDPNYAECYSQIGIVYSRQGKYTEALELMDKTIALKPDYAYGWTDKGWIYQSMEKWNDMLDAFENALRIGGDKRLQAQGWDGKGSAYYHLKRYDEAMSAYNKAIQLNPARFETYTHKGKLLIAQGNYRDAITEFDKTIERNPAYSEAWWFKAVALENLGDRQGAITAQAQAVSLDPVKYGSKPLPAITTQQTPSKTFVFF
jgi:tetratricopeptide (TPR) repeat protein